MLIEMVYQYVLIALISITGGYLFGVLIFMLMNKLMHQTWHVAIRLSLNVKDVHYFNYFSAGDVIFILD